MARVKIHPEQQLQRINQLKAELELFSSEPIKVLSKRASEKSWAVIEVIEHMTIACKEYEAKINSALKQLNNLDQPIDELRSRAVPSMLIKRFPPKDGKIRFKMKTMKRFQAVLDLEEISQEEINKMMGTYLESLNYLSEAVIQYRSKDVSRVIFNSAVGSWVKFNVAEAVEFIICHNERHHQQIKNTLKKVN